MCRKFVPTNAKFCIALMGTALFFSAPVSVAKHANASPVFANTPVSNGHANPSQTPPRYEINATPYVWASGLKGHVSPFRMAPTIGVKKTFHEVFDNLNLAGFLNIAGRYDNFVMVGDIMYVSLTDSKTFGPLPPSPLPIPPGSTLRASVDTKQFTASLLGGYRLIDTQNVTLDALAGLNYWHVSNELTLRVGRLSKSHKENFGWVDPIIGARTSLQLSDRLSLQAQANMGGFDIGSKFTWGAQGALNYTLNAGLSVSAGYKIMDVNYDRDNHVHDVRLNGPILGATWRF